MPIAFAGDHAAAARSGLRPGVIFAALLATAAYGLFAQSEAPPGFQVASVKPNTAAVRRAIIVRVQPGGRLTTEDAPLALLIQNAYRVQAFQIVGGPEWVNSDGYDIEAKPEGPADEKQVWLMLQTLIGGRFKLAIHRETRELPVYALTAAKNGMKLPPPKETSCVSSDAPRPPAVPCGALRVGKGMRGDNVPMAELVRILAMVMGRPVVNKTGFDGELDVRLDFTPDETTIGMAGAGGPRDPAGFSPPATDPDRPNIFAALQNQLGLKLESSRGPVEVLVIDHVERPSAN